MPTIAEMLVGSALESSQKAPDLAGHFNEGAKLGLHIQEVRMQRQQLEQKKAENEMEKFKTVGGWLDTYSKMPEGGAKQAFGKKFVPNGIASLGLQDKIHPNVIEMMTGDPVLGAFLTTEIRNGRLDVSTLTDPAAVADYYAQHGTQFGALEDFKAGVAQNLPSALEAEKLRMTETGKTERANIVQSGQATRQEKEIASAGPKKLATDLASKYSDYTGSGGKAGMESSLANLEEAAKALETGKVTTGGVTTIIPGFKSDAAQSVINPKLVEVRTQAQTALNTVLRATLGAQFTAQEGERVLNQVWDDKLAPAVNAKKIRTKIKELRANVKNAEGEFVKQGYMSAPSGASAPQNLKDIFSAAPAAKQAEYIKAYAAKNNISEAEAKKALGGK